MAIVRLQPDGAVAPLVFPIFGIGPFDEMQDILLKKFRNEQTQHGGAHSIIRMVLVNASRSANVVRQNGGNLSISAFKQDANRIYMFRE